MGRFCSLLSFCICDVLSCNEDGDKTVFSYRSGRLVVVACIFSGIKLSM